MGFALMWGIKRALFSSEAAQGTAPIAHIAAKTDEPVREGVVAGLEPFIDTIVICTLTALVILVTGAHSRGPEAYFPDPAQVRVVQVRGSRAHDGRDPCAAAAHAGEQAGHGGTTRQRLERCGLPRLRDAARRAEPGHRGRRRPPPGRDRRQRRRRLDGGRGTITGPSSRRGSSPTASAASASRSTTPAPRSPLTLSIAPTPGSENGWSCSPRGSSPSPP